MPSIAEFETTKQKQQQLTTTKTKTAWYPTDICLFFGLIVTNDKKIDVL
jgi:hypothetical protein